MNPSGCTFSEHLGGQPPVKGVRKRPLQLRCNSFKIEYSYKYRLFFAIKNFRNKGGHDRNKFFSKI